MEMLSVGEPLPDFLKSQVNGFEAEKDVCRVSLETDNMFILTNAPDDFENAKKKTISLYRQGGAILFLLDVTFADDTHLKLPIPFDARTVLLGDKSQDFRPHMSDTTYLTVKFIQVREDNPRIIRSLAFFTVTPVFQMTMKDAVTSALNENQFDNYVGQVNKLINKIHFNERKPIISEICGITLPK